MTLIKSMLLGSAAGIVAVAGAQAADLPTHKAAPVEYVKVCNVGGITGWVLPGSDTCVKLSGYITAQFEGGNLQTQYNCALIRRSRRRDRGCESCTLGDSRQLWLPLGHRSTQRVLIAASNSREIPRSIVTRSAGRPAPTSASTSPRTPPTGPLIGHFDFNGEIGNGFDNTGTATYVNTAYLTWAGITAGKAASFYSFTGGGDNWANFFSPDRKGFNEPDPVCLHRLVRRRLLGDDLGSKARARSAVRAAAPA